MKFTRRNAAFFMASGFGLTLNGGKTLFSADVIPTFPCRDSLARADYRLLPKGSAARLLGDEIGGDFKFVKDASLYLARIPPLLRGVQTMIVPLFGDETGRSGAWVRLGHEHIRPEWFGSGRRGVDDAFALQAAFDQIGRGGRRVFLSGQYVISRRVEIVGKKDFEVFGDGSIVAASSMPVRSDFQCLLVSDCQDFSIAGITVDGNRRRRTPAETAAHAMELRSCRKYVLQRLTLIDSVTDCLYIATASNEVGDISRHNQGAHLVDCRFENGFRQGVSIIQGRDIRFTRCRFAGTNGTPPAAGCDLESNERDVEGAIRNIIFEDCIFENSAGYGLLVGSARKPNSIDVRNCRFVNNRKGAVSWNGDRGRLIDCSFEGFDGAIAERGLIDIGASPKAGGLSVVRPAFSSLRNQDPGHPLLYVHRLSKGQVRMDGARSVSASHIVNFRADDCQISGGQFIATDASAFAFSGARGSMTETEIQAEGYPCVRVSGDDCHIEGCELIGGLPSVDGPLIQWNGKGGGIRDTTFVASGRAGAAVKFGRGARASMSGNSVAGFAAVHFGI